MARETVTPLHAPAPEELCSDGALRVADACTFTGLSRTTLYGLSRSGRIDLIRIGGRTLIPKRQLVELLAAGIRR